MEVGHVVFCPVAQQRLPMRKIREVLRLKFEAGLSDSAYRAGHRQCALDGAGMSAPCEGGRHRLAAGGGV